MQKIQQKFKLKTLLPDQGFTLLEVLVSILIATMFLMSSMQGLVLATMFRVKSQQIERANLWMQEDLEQVKFLASTKPTADNAKCSASTYDTGYAKALSDDLDTLAPTTPDRKILGKTFRLQRTYESYSGSPTFNVLRINYQVNELDDNGNIVDPNDPIAEDYTEVIPNVAFQCQ